MLRVGELRRDDRGRVAEILRETGVFRNAEVEVALELFDEAVPDGGDPSSTDYAFVGAFDAADSLKGFACYGPTPGTDRTYDLYWLAVAPSAQRTGAGSRLVSAVEERLRADRGRMVVAETSSREDYGPTRAFYQQRGYGQAASVRDFYASGDDRVIYTKRLDS